MMARNRKIETDLDKCKKKWMVTPYKKFTNYDTLFYAFPAL